MPRLRSTSPSAPSTASQSWSISSAETTRGGAIGRMKAGTPIAGATLTWAASYEDIAESKRIVFCQTLDRDGLRISVALITAEFVAQGAGCRLVFTHQAAFFEGSDGPQMREHGWRYLLDAVAGTLED